MIHYTWPSCGKDMSAPDSIIGQKEKCPSCGNKTIVPEHEVFQAQEKNKTKYLTRSLLFALILGVLVFIIGRNGNDSDPSAVGNSSYERNQAENNSQTSSSVPNGMVPTYRVLKNDVYDAPIKTQVSLDLLITGKISEESVRDLLLKIFTNTANQRNFKYHSKPTHIFIYAYSDIERARSSGIGQWVGMLSKAGKMTRPEIRINQKLIAQLGTNPIIKFGLSEKKRKQIWTELVLVEDRARAEAESKHPLAPEKALKPGHSLRLTKVTALMPELNPADAMKAIERIRGLPAGTTIRIFRVAKKRGIPWYAVTAYGQGQTKLGVGWINSIALYGQTGVDLKAQIKKQSKLMSELVKKYESTIAKSYRLTSEQLNSISVEGLKKSWPFP